MFSPKLITSRDELAAACDVQIANGASTSTNTTPTQLHLLARIIRHSPRFQMISDFQMIIHLPKIRAALFLTPALFVSHSRNPPVGLPLVLPVMATTKPRVRLRQAVLVAAELEPVASALRSALNLDEPFRDHGVGWFGLANVVFALGDCFVEVVSPIQPDTTAGRYLARHGDGGYMVIFDVEDLQGARRRALDLGVRAVWQIDLPDISATHLHPADMRGAIVSLDRSEPYGTWRWGGPQWTGRIGDGAPGRLSGVTLAVGDPAAVAARWAAVLGLDVSGDAQPLLRLDGGEVRFETAASERAEGLVEIAVELPHELPGGHGATELGGVRVRRADTAD